MKERIQTATDAPAADPVNYSIYRMAQAADNMTGAEAIEV
jgi:hypothetical protein